MEIRIPKQGDVYRHFKGNLYQVIIIARDSETLEEKVVYKELNGEAAYVRSLPMFLSPVDKVKYPNADQEFRFELVENCVNLEKEDEPEETAALEKHLVMDFLELTEVTEKIHYLRCHKNDVTSEFLEIVAQSLDFVENDKTLQERYEAILYYLCTVERYESGRFR